MSMPHAVIIAGGAGQRLGGIRKADLRIGGIRQIRRVIDALEPVSTPMLVSTGPAENRIALGDDCEAVADLDSPIAGPLAGLAAAVDRLMVSGVRQGLLVSVAVDTPFLPTSFVGDMQEALGDAPAAYAAWGEDFYPPNAIWRIEQLLDLPGVLRDGTAPNSLKVLQSALGARRVDWAERFALNPFLNINTVADLLILQRFALR